MDLLHSGRFDGFCLVSSDSDFTRLASRIREEGADVYGFGKKTTPESFRSACRRFIDTENLAVTPAASVSAVVGKPLRPVAAATKIISDIIGQMEGDDGWVALGGLGSQLANHPSDFDPRTYGFRKLSDLVRGANAFEIEHPPGGTLKTRLKPKPHPVKGLGAQPPTLVRAVNQR